MRKEDRLLGKIVDEVGANFDCINIVYETWSAGISVRAEACVNVYGDDRNHLDTGHGRTVVEALEDLLDNIVREKEVYIWPWWSEIHSNRAWAETARRKWPKNNP